MNRISTASVLAALIALAGPAMADDDQSVLLQGNVDPECRLPTSWAYVSGFNGPNGSHFNGTTFTIPQSALVTSSSTPVAGGEYAIRVRGTGFCNTSHTISITSVRGGLTVDGDPAAPAPAGFINRRSLAYEAGWRNDTLNDWFGPAVQMTANTPGQSASRNFTVSGALAPPGNRAFDVRIGMARPAGQPPMVAGAYSDQLVITLTTF